MTTAKILLNGAVSMPGAAFVTHNAKDFYLNVPMDTYKYMRIIDSYIPTIALELYNQVCRKISER